MNQKNKKAPRGGAFKQPGGPIRNNQKEGCYVSKATPVGRQSHALVNVVGGGL